MSLRHCNKPGMSAKQWHDYCQAKGAERRLMLVERYAPKPPMLLPCLLAVVIVVAVSLALGLALSELINWICEP